MNEIQIYDYVEQLQDTDNKIFCSMKPKNEDEEVILYNAMNNPEKRLSDCINMVISVKDVFCEIVQCKREDQVENVPRVVLIDDKGVGYQCVSLGVFSALRKMFAIKGFPDNWSKPLKVRVVQITKGERKMLTLEMTK